VDIGRVELVDGELVGSRLVEHPVIEVVFVDHHHREVTVPCVGEGHGGATADIDHRRAVQRIAIHPDDHLTVKRRRFSEMPPLVDAAGLGENPIEHPGCLRPDEVVDIHWDH